MKIQEQEQVAFLDEWAEAIDRTVPADDQLAAETEAINFATEIDDKDTALTALSHLLERLKTEQSQARVSRLIGEARYGAKPILEISAHELPVAVERLLEGKHTAVVVRNNEGASADNLIAELSASGVVPKGKPEIFPNEKMKSTGSKNSDVHLDVFGKDLDIFYPYSISMSQVTEGEVLFVGAQASSRARKMGDNDYNHLRQSLNASRPIKKLVNEAKQGHPPRNGSIKVPQEITPEQQLYTVALSEGDTVIWSQGGPGSKAPTWHGFYQIGDVPRQSISYHLVKENNADTIIDLRDK